MQPDILGTMIDRGFGMENTSDNTNQATELELLKAKIEKYEQALDKEVWNSKLGKFVKFRDMPEVVRVLKNE